MSGTFKHKGKGKFKNTKIPIYKIHKSTLLMWDRYNSDFGEDKERQNRIKEKISKKEFKKQLEKDEYNFKQNGELIEDIDDPYYTSRMEER